jgi:hypothetical protein
VLEIGAEIRGYRIERLLGRGGMGEVYEATQLELGRRVAFKVLHTRLGQDEGFRERFRREGRLQAALEHPHVVTVYEAGELDSGLFLAMRLVDGSTLKQLIVAGELDAGRTLRILGPVADALDAAHRGGLVHRDVKPQNILVGAGDHAFLADFGLTRGQDQSGFTRSGQFVGTIDYISPEQLRGEPAGPASDVYALGGVLYECLTGSVPYARPSDAAVLYAHVNDEPPAATASRPDLPAAIDDVLARALAKEPESRQASASELIADAAAAVGDDPRLASSRPPRRDPLAHGVRPVAGDTADADVPATGATGAQTGATPATAAGRATPAGAAGGATPATVADASPSGRGRTSAAPALAALAALAVLAVLAVLAFVGGRALGGGEDPSALTTSVSGNAVSLSAPAGWGPTTRPERPAIPGLTLRDATGVAPAEDDGSGIVAGMTDAGGPSLLPAKLVERIRGGPGKPAAVQLGELEALRYRDVRARGFDGRLTLYASPSSVGVATVACYAPTAEAAAYEPVCESVARTLELLDGRAYPLATSPDTESTLREIVNRLGRSRAGGRRRLARAAAPAGQAAGASALARAYREQARRLRGLETGPALTAGATHRAAAAAERAATAYGRLAAAARSGNGAGYGAARAAVRSAEARLERSVAAIETAGRTVRTER